MYQAAFLAAFVEHVEVVLHTHSYRFQAWSTVIGLQRENVQDLRRVICRFEERSECPSPFLPNTLSTLLPALALNISVHNGPI